MTAAHDPSVAGRPLSHKVRKWRRDTSPSEWGGKLLKFREWQLALPLALAFAALFFAPLMLLVGVSFFNDEKISQPGFASWAKFFGDPFNYKVIADTLLLGAKTVCTTVVIGYPLALVYLDLPARLQKMLLFMIVMPLLLSVLVRTFAWIVMLGRAQPIKWDIEVAGSSHGRPPRISALQ